MCSFILTQIYHSSRSFLVENIFSVLFKVMKLVWHWSPNVMNISLQSFLLRYPLADQDRYLTAIYTFYFTGSIRTFVFFYLRPTLLDIIKLIKAINVRLLYRFYWTWLFIKRSYLFIKPFNVLFISSGFILINHGTLLFGYGVCVGSNSYRK